MNWNRLSLFFFSAISEISPPPFQCIVEQGWHLNDFTPAPLVRVTLRSPGPTMISLYALFPRRPYDAPQHPIILHLSPIALPSTPVSFLCSPEHVWSLNSIRLHKISIRSFKVNHSSNLWHPLQYRVMWYIWSCSLKYSKIKLRFWEICTTELVVISKSLIACRWMLDFIDLLHFYRSQPLMGRRHLRVNQQGRLVVESFCRRCRFECHGAQWCGPAGSSRISRLQAWCCAFRRSSLAGGGWIWVYMRFIGCSLWGVGGIVGWLVGQSGWKWRSDKALETWGAPRLVATTCAAVSSWDLPWLLLHAGGGGGQVQAFSSGDPHQTGWFHQTQLKHATCMC